MKTLQTILLLNMIILVSACNSSETHFDATGTFEAEETIISAEATGRLIEFDLEEGQVLNAAEIIGYIDSIQLFLKKKQLEAQITSVLSRQPNVNVQLATLYEQLAVAEKEKIRTVNLVKGDAATAKQLDDIDANIQVLKKQIEAHRSNLLISTKGITNDVEPLKVQVEQLDDQLRKCKLVNPTKGTVLSKYAGQNEMALQGKPLYKLADLSTMILRAYITGDQLPRIKLQQKIKVLTDDGNGGFTEKAGEVIWINDKAEFTPKTIQTKAERANMVYAIKVKVPNDGTYKIGMYGEIKFK